MRFRSGLISITGLCLAAVVTYALMPADRRTLDIGLPVMLMIAPLCQAVDNARQAENRQVLEVFVRDGCPHCANA